MGYGRGGGYGRGRGFGFGMGGFAPYPGESYYPGAYAQPNPTTERAFLEDQMGALQEELEGIKQRLSELVDQEKED
jgi:hypothetical protein